MLNQHRPIHLGGSAGWPSGLPAPSNRCWIKYGRYARPSPGHSCQQKFQIKGVICDCRTNTYDIERPREPILTLSSSRLNPGNNNQGLNEGTHKHHRCFMAVGRMRRTDKMTSYREKDFPRNPHAGFSQNASNKQRVLMQRHAIMTVSHS